MNECASRGFGWRERDSDRVPLMHLSARFGVLGRDDQRLVLPPVLTQQRSVAVRVGELPFGLTLDGESCEKFRPRKSCILCSPGCIAMRASGTPRIIVHGSTNRRFTRSDATSQLFGTSRPWTWVLSRVRA